MQTTKQEILSRMIDFRKGADWILRLLELEAEEVGVTKETREWVSEMITKYREML